MELSVMIGIPAYRGEVGYSLMHAILGLIRERPDVGIFINPGRASLTLVRDEIVNTFLANKECHTLVMIDTDVKCTKYDIDNLIKCPCDFVSACVPPRSGHKRAGQYYTGELEDESDKNGHLRKAKYLPCSMMKVTRYALEKANNIPVVYEDNGKEFLNWFPCGVVNGRLLTEAYYFSHIMRLGGIQPYMDFSNMNIGHGD